MHDPQRPRRIAQRRIPARSTAVNCGLIVSQASTPPANRSFRPSSNAQHAAIRNRTRGPRLAHQRGEDGEGESGDDHHGDPGTPATASLGDGR